MLGEFEQSNVMIILGGFSMDGMLPSLICLMFDE